jgi:hypothetical protein
LAKADGAGQVTVSYAVASPAPSLHEPVIVVTHIENRGTETIIANLGADFKKHFVMTVTTPDGTTTPPLPPPFPEVGGIARLGRVSIPGGGQYSSKLLLNEWYDFSEVGTYRIRLELKNGFSTVTDAALDVPAAATIGVEMTPRNEWSLRAICEELAATVESASSTQTMLDAAHTLEYVTDPIAVPYIRRVMAKTNWVDWILFEGLARIGNEEAREVLVSAAGDSGERAELARGALARFHQGI